MVVKIQVKMPDTLLREAKRLAAENEMSFAEVVRRGLEEIIKHHPPGRTRAESWPLPEIASLSVASSTYAWPILCSITGSLSLRRPTKRILHEGTALSESGILCYPNRLILFARKLPI